MRSDSDGCKCNCLGCGDDADHVALGVLKLVTAFQDRGCPAAAILPGMAIALGVVACTLAPSATAKAVHEIIDRAWPRAQEHLAFMRAEASAYAN